MQRPVSQDETLDTNDVKNSSLLASNGKNMATLRAYDAIALEVNKYQFQIGNLNRHIKRRMILIE